MLVVRIAAAILGVAGLAACAPHMGKPRISNGDAHRGSSLTVVTAEDFARIGGQGSLMEGLATLRPFMLASRGTTAPQVSVDGAPLAELSLLRMIPLQTVREVRLLRSSSSVGQPAIVPNGGVIVGTVIVVTTWPGHRLQR